MSWRDRPYSGGEFGGNPGRGMGLGFMKPTPAVLAIIAACVAFFLVSAFSRGNAYGNGAFDAAALILPPGKPLWQVWRYVTYQYLHGGVGHLFWNMLGLFFFGPPLERIWGSRKFLTFYTLCGVVGGVAFALMQWLFSGGMMQSFLVGASGSVLGCLAANAVLFPQTVLLLLFFPVPIRVAAIAIAGLYSLTIIAERNLADVAHLAGMAAGVAWIYVPRRWPNLQFRRASGEGIWQRKIQNLAEDEQKVDHILDKIRKHGMGSLTWWEKRFLHQATERRRQFDEQQSRRY